MIQVISLKRRNSVEEGLRMCPVCDGCGKLADVRIAALLVRPLGAKGIDLCDTCAREVTRGLRKPSP